jgi:O-acetyl-ADP-ribose deacetylase (regulator of RNase III)
VFKEADTLEMPTVAIAPTTFAIGGFSRDSILPAFVDMFNQYKFTNDDFLTDIKFIGSAEEFDHLRAVAEHCTSAVTGSKPKSHRGSGNMQILRRQPGVAVVIVTGDIAQFSADAIVVPVNSVLDMKGAIAKTFNDVSGGNLLKKISNLRGRISEGRVLPVVCEEQWNIQAQFLYFLCQSKYTKMDTLKQACTQALKTAKDHNLTSIAFPPVTTHKGKDEVAKAMHEVFTTFQQQNLSDLTITVVIKKDDNTTHKAFIRYFLPHSERDSSNGETTV